MEKRGYGPFPYSPITERPKLSWPGGARVAVWVVPNIEYFPLDEPLVERKPESVPSVQDWSMRDYGNRVAIFRLREVLDRFGIRATVNLNSDICLHHPQIIEGCVARDYDFLGHCQTNVRWLNTVPAEDERELIFETLDVMEKSIGRRPRGWVGSALQETWNSLDYLLEAGCDFVGDWVNDDQPYRMDVGGKQMISLPYAAEINDMFQFIFANRTADEFETMAKRHFDVLYREGEDQVRSMAIGLHPYIIGVPHRIDCLANILEHMAGHDHVWFATASEIVDHYVKSTNP
ncbi:MAG: polysaccharide deacetylase family protein [Rhodospirillales bacterium]|nr:polysaccharide deacetylase family protein [Rhodospirillales bacterium]